MQQMSRPLPHPGHCAHLRRQTGRSGKPQRPHLGVDPRVRPTTAFQTPQTVRGTLKPMETTMEHACADVPLLQGDAGFAQEVMAGPGGETLPLCYQCGTCTGCCPVGAVDEDFSPAQIIQWIRLGLRERVLGSPKIWLCLQCHRCSFSCPQGVRFADINGTLRHLAVREGFLPASTAEALALVERHLAALRCAVLERALQRDFPPTRSIGALVQDVLRDLHG